MATFFTAPQDRDMGEVLSSGYKAGYDIREGERKKALNNIFSQSVNPDGSFNSENFLTKAAAANVGPELVTAWLGQKTAKSDAATKEATNSDLLDMLGRDPDALRDWHEQEKQRKAKQEDATNYGLQQEQAAKQAILDKQTGADQFLNPSVGNTNLPQERQKSISSPTIEQGKTMDLGSSTLAEGRMVDPGYYGAGGLEPKLGANTIPQDRKYDVVEESLRRKGGAGGGGVSVQSSPLDTSFTSELTDWNPVDNGSNEYRQYSAALKDKLSGMGLTSNSEYLQKLGENVYKQNLYIPNPAAMFKDGKLDMAAQGAELSKAAQSKIVAQGKADQAILEARAKLVEEAQKYGVGTVDARSLDIGNKDVKYTDEKGIEHKDGQYKLRDKSYRPQATALLTNKVLLAELNKELREASGDITKLSLVAPSVIRALSTAANPGQQLSEGNLHENAQKLATNFTDDPAMIPKFVGAALLALKGNIKPLTDLFTGYANAMSPAVYGKQLNKMKDEAELMTGMGVESFMIAPGQLAKEDDIGKTTPIEIKTKDWYDNKPGDKFFQSKNKVNYEVTRRDRFGYPIEATDKNDKVFTITDIGEGVELSPKDWLDSKPVGPKPRKGNAPNKKGPLSGVSF